MNKYKFVALMFFILLLVLPLSFAQPPFETQSAGLLEIAYPKTEFFAQGEMSKLHFHIYNSTGALVTDGDVNCTLHIYDSANSHIEEVNLTPDSNGVDLYANITSPIYNSLGFYTYIVWCTASNGEGGFLSNFFEVTVDGKNPERFAGSWLPVILALAFLTLLCFMVSNFVRSDKFEFLRYAFFNYGLVNMFFLGWSIYLVVLHPARVDFAKPVFTAYFGVSSLVVMLLLWLFGFAWLGRISTMIRKLMGKGGDS